jgi:Ni/Co efflux regulator RcnB
MRKFTTLLLFAAAVLPVAANAQTSRGELARDRRDVREERRELDRALATGDRREVRDEREDLREAKQEYREDLRDRNRYAYRQGIRISRAYYEPRYYIAQPWRYKLARPTGYDRWVRHSNNVLLINTRTGYVRQVRYGFFR